jgi:hypothetical protein
MMSPCGPKAKSGPALDMSGYRANRKPFEDRRTKIYHVARYRVMAVGKSRLVPRLTLSW